MKSARILLVGIATLFTVTAATAQYHKYDTWDENYTIGALLGAVKYDDLEFDIPDSGGTQTLDISTLPQLGGVWGTLPKGEGAFNFGLECSFLLGFRFDKVNYAYLGGNGAYISLSTSMWMFDLAGGPYANWYLGAGRKVRLYAGAGPLMTYAYYQTDRNSVDDPTLNGANSESVFGLGLYARTGVEFRVHHYGMLGLGVRGTYSNVDFTEFGGSSELKGIAGFITYTAGL